MVVILTEIHTPEQKGWPVAINKGAIVAITEGSFNGSCRVNLSYGSPVTVKGTFEEVVKEVFGE